MASGQKHLKYQVGATIICLTTLSQGTIVCINATGAICQATATFTDGSTVLATAWEHGCSIRLAIATGEPIPVAISIPVGATILN